jgi:hypothetical protein
MFINSTQTKILFIKGVFIADCLNVLSDEPHNTTELIKPDVKTTLLCDICNQNKANQIYFIVASISKSKNKYVFQRMGGVKIGFCSIKCTKKYIINKNSRLISFGLLQNLDFYIKQLKIS